MSDEPKCVTEGEPSWRLRTNRPRVLSSIASSTLNYAQSLGVTLADVNAVVRINRFEMLDPLARVDEQVIPTVWRLIDRAAPSAALSVHMASAVGIETMGPVSTVTRFAPTVREALETIARFTPILSESVKTDLVEERNTLVIVASSSTDTIDGGYASEAGLAMTYRLIRSVLGGVAGIVRIEMAHAPFGPLRAYEDFFQVPVIPSVGRHAIVIDQAVAEQPTAEADHILADFARSNLELLEDRFGIRQAELGHSNLLRAVADLGPAAGYRVTELAERMNLSERSLQRMAEAEGVSLRQLLTEAREARARQLLADPSLTIGEVARRVGYSDERSFRRAFRRWTGSAPSAFRAR